MAQLPIIGITMGDPASIGPEIAIKALLQEKIYSICRPLLVGDAGVFKDIILKLKLKATINPVNKVSDAKFEFGIIDVFDLHNVELDKLVFGEISAMAGPHLSMRLKK